MFERIDIGREGKQEELLIDHRHLTHRRRNT
jgi:hypothetical protein